MGSFSSGFEKSGRVPPNEPGGPNPAAWILGVVPEGTRPGLVGLVDGVVACCGSGFRIMGGKTAGRSPRGGMSVGSRVIPTVGGSRVIPDVGAAGLLLLSGRSLGMRWKISLLALEVESSFSKGPAEPAPGVAMVGGRIVGLTEGVENFGLVGLKAGLVTVLVGENGFLAAVDLVEEVGSMLINVPAGSVNREVAAVEGLEIFEGLKGRRVVVTSIVDDNSEFSNSLVLNGKLSVLIRIGLVGRMTGRLENVPSITEISSSITLVGSIRSIPAAAGATPGKAGRESGRLEGVGLCLKSRT